MYKYDHEHNETILVFVKIIILLSTLFDFN